MLDIGARIKVLQLPQGEDMAHLTPKGCWRAQVRSYGRIVASKTFPRGAQKSEAEAWEIRTKNQLTQIRHPGGGPTLGEFIHIYFREHAALHLVPSTFIKRKIDIEKHLMPAFGQTPLSSIRAKHIAEFQATLWRGGTGLSAQSIGNILSALGQVLKFAVVKDVIDINPSTSVRRIKRPKRAPTFWSIAERDRFLIVCRRHDFALFQMVALAVTTGLRPGELQGLQRSRLDFEESLVIVDQNWCPRTKRLNPWTKGKLDRVVSVPPRVMEILHDKRNLPSATFVFAKIQFNTLGHRLLKPMARRAGVPPIRFHDLRHTFASHCVLKGKHPIEIRDLLGHSQLASTDMYMHLRKDYLKGATDCLVEGTQWLDLKKPLPVPPTLTGAEQA